MKQVNLSLKWSDDGVLTLFVSMHEAANNMYKKMQWDKNTKTKTYNSLKWKEEY